MPDTEFLRKVSRMSIDGIYVYDLELQTNVYVNDRYTQITGYRADDINVMRPSEFAELFHPEDRQAVFDHRDKVIADRSGNSHSLRYRFRHRNGSWIWCQSLDMAFTRDEEGRCTQVIGSFIDISDLIENERRARDLGIMMEAMLANVSTAALVIDADNQLHVFNDAAQKLLDYKPPRLPMPFELELTFAERESLSFVGDPLQEAQVGIFYDNRILALYPGERKPLKYVRMSSIPLHGTTGNRVMFTLKDVTEDETNRQQRERAERLDALGQLTGGIAHDFNNVLASILPTAQVAQKLTQDPQSLKLLGIIESSAKRGALLANRLLAFARRQPVTESDVHVGTLLDNLSDLAQSTVGRQVAFRCLPTDDNIYVHCDAAQLENALLNLIINSRDAIIETGKGGEVTVACRRCAPLDQSSPMIEFTVTDDGPGMSEAVMARAFDPFFTTRSTTSGTGLGLSTVYGFAKQADGHVKLYSDRGIGTTVRLSLPAIIRNRPHLGDMPQAAPADTVRGRGTTILVVEDEPDLLQSVVEFLRILDFNPVPALNGEVALAEMAKRRDIDLLITDIMMPGGMNGFELAIAAREVQPDLGIIYMSGYTGFVNDERRQVDGAFLQKPCDMTSLSRALRNALGERVD
ncbi:ATP-binding protein [Roseibium aestuarii]|uniref:histidine kinase n=1 Tax=Roseibium aestuarii TaxID=2600299 RepID=A0ABW4JQX8_9HYPH|nr:ATP-binding protein [Roseibium aestuarii]